MEPLLKRADMLARGDLVVCLRPYPDLVNMAGLSWLNKLYQSYRAWQRWLLAERVYHELEIGGPQTPLKSVMFNSVTNVELGFGVRYPSRHGRSDGEGQGYLFVEMPIGENSQQKGRWLA